MERKTAGQRPSETTRRPRRRWRGAALLAAIAALGLSLAACGGGGSSRASSGSSDPGSSGSGSAANSTASEALKFASCMRSHGVKNYQDPTVSGGNAKENFGSGSSAVNPDSPTYQSAARACQKYQPTNNAGSSQQGPNPAAQLKFAKCMRSHGVTNFPDPNGSGQMVAPPLGSTKSSTYTAAQAACEKVLSGS